MIVQRTKRKKQINKKKQRRKERKQQIQKGTNKLCDCVFVSV